MPGFARSSAGIPLRDGLLANTIALIYFLCILPFVALLSDRIGRKPTLLGFAIGFMLFAYPGIAMIQGGFWMLVLLPVEVCFLVYCFFLLVKRVPQMLG